MTTFYVTIAHNGETLYLDPQHPERGPVQQRPQATTREQAERTAKDWNTPHTPAWFHARVTE